MVYLVIDNVIAQIVILLGFNNIDIEFSNSISIFCLCKKLQQISQER